MGYRKTYFSLNASKNNWLLLIRQHALDTPERTSIKPKLSPFSVKVIGRVDIPHLTPRLAAQSGTFTIHPEPEKPVDASKLTLIRVPSKLRRDLKRLLHRYGINERSLFPGLDGLAHHLRWMRTAVY